MSRRFRRNLRCRFASGTAILCCSSIAVICRRCCAGSASVRVDDIAIGTEDLRSLYDQFHGPNVPDEEAPV